MKRLQIKTVSHMAVAVMAAILVLFSCKKDPEIPKGDNKIVFGATVSDTVSYVFAKVSTQLNSFKGNQISQHGHCWSTESNPDIEDSHDLLGGIGNTGKFTSDLSGLTDNTKYFIRSYITFQGGTIYGTQKEIMTLKRGKPVANSGIAFDITPSFAKISGTVTFDSGYAITQKGICWDTVSNPSVYMCVGYSEEGAGLGSFTSSVTNLMENKQYYYSAYATNEKGTSYGTVLSFYTGIITLPVVTTSSYSNVTTTSATCGGNVTNAGNGNVSARGVCWNTTGNPTLDNSLDHTTNGGGTGTFTSIINGLNEGTTYFVTAYATNEKGSVYGIVFSFQTKILMLPVVTTSPCSNITVTSATCGGNVIDSGNGNVSARGVCWNTTGNPNLANSLDHTTNGNGIGVFTSIINGLQEGTTYFVTAYATNEKGTTYGDPASFKTALKCGYAFIVNHIAGAVAPVTKSVTYGTVTNITGEPSKCWITSNLGSDHHATAVNDATEASAGWYWQFNRKQGYKNDGTTVTPAWPITSISETSDWEIVNDPCIIELGAQWRVPTYIEWYNVDNTGGWINWNGPWGSGLRLHAAGDLDPNNGSLYSRGSSGCYWSSNQYDDIRGWFLSFKNVLSSTDGIHKVNGFSIRCIRDY